jgi:trehalose 6-phosphate phosphatase
MCGIVDRHTGTPFMHWQDSQDLLQPLTQQKRLGVITDFDGVLSEIVDNPDDSTIYPASKTALKALQPHLALLAVVSGRGAAAIHRMTGLEDVIYVGNHGMERWVDGEVVVPDHVAAYRPNLEAVLATVADHLEDGMRVEDKGATASVHYRQTANPSATAERLEPALRQITEANDIDLHTGKMVFELRPPIDQNKGTAFRSLMDEFDLHGAIFLGDDVTDAAALAAAQALRSAGTHYTVGVGVRHEDDTPQAVLDHSDVLADGVADVASLLDWLKKALSASST